MQHGAQGDIDKRPLYHGSFSGSQNSLQIRSRGHQDKNPPCQSYQHQGQTSRPIHYLLQLINGFIILTRAILNLVQVHIRSLPVEVAITSQPNIVEIVKLLGYVMNMGPLAIILVHVTNVW